VSEPTSSAGSLAGGNMAMTCPKSLGPSLHAQPEPWDSVVNLGTSPLGTPSSGASPFTFSVMNHHLLRVPHPPCASRTHPPQTLADVWSGIHTPRLTTNRYCNRLATR
jgi:hypothetical protein